jgi:1-acyl-sn-glycerol-3-phosphate acyltransferase
MTWQKLGSELPLTDNPITKRVGRTLLRWWGWRLEGHFPNRSKMVVAVLPHSSNIDFLLTVAVLWGMGLKASFMAKHTLFKFPFGGFFRSLGGVPVDRRSAQGMVGQMASEFERRKQLVLGIAPEGTRSNSGDLKAGFARIAEAASVPVLPTIINYKQKTIRFGELINDVSDVSSVIEQVKVEALTGMRRRAIPSQ